MKAQDSIQFTFFYALLLLTHFSTNLGQSSLIWSRDQPPPPIVVCTSGAPCSCYNDVIDCQNQNLTSSYIRPFATSVTYTNISFRQNRLTRLWKDRLMSLGQNGIEFVHTLDFSQNQISVIDDGCFNGFESLKTLLLTNNKLTTVRNQWFEGLDMSLENLHLDGNLITRLERDSFKPLTELQQLILMKNFIVTIQPGAFTGLALLRRLDLDQNNLTHHLSPRAFDDLLHLEKLSLRFNYLASMPNFPRMPSLVSLYLDGLLFKTIPKYAFKNLPNLEELYMDAMQFLDSVEECAFCGLIRLKKFVLSDSKLKELPRSAFDSRFGSTTMMISLDLSTNNLSTLSADFFDWKNIANLLLESNAWICDCRLTWMLDEKQRIGDNPECRHPNALEGLKIKTLSKQDLCPSMTSSTPKTPMTSSYVTPKVFVTITVLMIIFSTALISWYLCAGKTSNGIIDGLFRSGRAAGAAAGADNKADTGNNRGSRVPKVNRHQPYAYRNLAMMQQQEDLADRGLRTRPEEDEVHVELTVNPAFNAMERASML